jgi:hypothetical protein
LRPEPTHFSTVFEYLVSMLRFLTVLLLFCSINFRAFAQETEPYFIRITVDKIRLGNDSVKFSKPKTLYIYTSGKPDTTEITSIKGTRLAIVTEVRKVMVGKTIRYQIGYAWYKRSGTKWELIRHFGYVDRFALLSKPDEVKNSKALKPAREQLYCSIGEPMVFSCSFRMDVYLNK